MGRYVVDYFATNSSINSNQIQTISVSLQDGNWNLAILDFILKCDQLMKNKINWLIQTRRTPISDLKSQFKFPENFRFNESTVYDAIAQTDVHMTIFSTTAIEALSMGKQVVLYDFENAATSHLSNFFGENKFVHFVNAVSDFVSFVENYQNTNKEVIQLSNIENIRPNYIENLDTYLKRIANEVF